MCLMGFTIFLNKQILFELIKQESNKKKKSEKLKSKIHSILRKKRFLESSWF